MIQARFWRRFWRFHIQPQSVETVNAQADSEKNWVEEAEVFPCRLTVAREMIRVRRLPGQPSNATYLIRLNASLSDFEYYFEQENKPSSSTEIPGSMLPISFCCSMYSSVFRSTKRSPSTFSSSFSCKETGLRHLFLLESEWKFSLLCNGQRRTKKNLERFWGQSS